MSLSDPEVSKEELSVLGPYAYSLRMDGSMNGTWITPTSADRSTLYVASERNPTYRQSGKTHGLRNLAHC